LKGDVSEVSDSEIESVVFERKEEERVRDRTNFLGKYSFMDPNMFFFFSFDLLKLD